MTSTHKKWALIGLAIFAVGLVVHDATLYWKVAVHVFAIPAIAYPLVYRNSPWRTGPTGKALMNKAISVALLFVLAIMKMHRPFPGDEYVVGAVVTYLGVAVTYQFSVMYRLKQNARAVALPDHEVTS